MHAVLMAVGAVLLLVVTCLSFPDSVRGTALVMIAAATVAVLVRHKALRDRIGLTMLMLILITVMGCVSTFYAVSGAYALPAALGVLIALCVVLVLLAYPAAGEAVGLRIASVLEVCVALISVFSVDLIATRWLSTPLMNFLGGFAEIFYHISGYESGVRITSIFGNANIFGGVAGIGVLLALGLAQATESKKERRLHLSCLYISATAFVLAFSMGAVASIAVAFAVYLLLEHRERRGGLFVLMLETLLTVMLSVVVIASVALDGWTKVQVIPLACLIAGAALLCLADQFVGCRVAEKLRGRGKLLLAAVAVALVLMGGFMVAAYQTTGGITLDAGVILRRSVYLDPGEYTLSVQGGEGVWVRIESQNHQNTMMHTGNVIYMGDLSQAAFAVPEDSLVVYLYFDTQQESWLESVQCVSAGETVKVPLGYKLLPEFVANRLQGLWANQNVIQRIVFFEDGLKLFRRSPVIGLGLGAFENEIYSVQSFAYVTRFIHNHYIQTMLETGLVGLILFLGLLGVSAAAILLSRKKEQFHPLTPALGALLIFMAIHAGVEVVFSSIFYLPFAFGVFALVDVCCGEVLPVSWMKPKLRSGICLVTAALLVAFGVLVNNNMKAARLVNDSVSIYAIERAVEIDPFEWEDHAVVYLGYAVQDGAPTEVRAKAEEYVQRLEKSEEHTLPYYIAQYYFDIGQVEKGMQSAEKLVDNNMADNVTWNKLMELLSVYEEDSEAYRSGIAALEAKRIAWNEENLGEIWLNEFSRGFVDRILAQA